MDEEVEVLVDVRLLPVLHLLELELLLRHVHREVPLDRIVNLVAHVLEPHEFDEGTQVVYILDIGCDVIFKVGDVFEGFLELPNINFEVDLDLIELILLDQALVLVPLQLPALRHLK